MGTHDCLPMYSNCINTNGSYNCRCKKGYEGDGRNCEGTVWHYVLAYFKSYEVVIWYHQANFNCRITYLKFLTHMCVHTNDCSRGVCVCL